MEVINVQQKRMAPRTDPWSLRQETVTYSEVELLTVTVRRRLFK